MADHIGVRETLLVVGLVAAVITVAIGFGYLQLRRVTRAAVYTPSPLDGHAVRDLEVALTRQTALTAAGYRPLHPEHLHDDGFIGNLPVGR